MYVLLRFIRINIMRMNVSTLNGITERLDIGGGRSNMLIYKNKSTDVEMQAKTQGKRLRPKNEYITNETGPFKGPCRPTINFAVWRLAVSYGALQCRTARKYSSYLSCTVRHCAALHGTIWHVRYSSYLSCAVRHRAALHGTVWHTEYLKDPKL
uniref:Uncharacterized protein n=1 Tax=Romanomermis culicivorax TaxID=13658 RepID=A0A915HJF1_ROMCU